MNPTHTIASLMRPYLEDAALEQRLDVTFDMIKALAKFPGKTVTYINDEAISAGALISAGTDEIHQIFVPGRICDVQDLCVDASGALLGIGVATVVLRIVRKCREKRALAHT